MKLLYQLSIRFYYVVIWVASFFSRKASEWINGRKRAINEIFDFQGQNNKVIWFHCASLGEFEQGKPVIESFKLLNPGWKVVITFFSPSGYNTQKKYELADLVTYLPIDTPKNVNLFLECIKPNLAVFIKYEFWYGYLQSLSRKKIPTVFISASFRYKQFFFKSYGSWFLSHLKNVTYYFVQDELSKVVLAQHDITQVYVSGDTRFDRVLQTYLANEELVEIERFKGDKSVLVFGSAWDVEWDIASHLDRALLKGWKVVIAPHEINLTKIEKIRKQLNHKSVLFSEIMRDGKGEFDFLIVDTIGHLSRIYKYADLAIVGGGFTDGIHNILEPLTFGSPVLFGPCHQKFWEAEAAINSGVGFEFEDAKDGLKTALNLMNVSLDQKELMKEKCKEFITFNSGATNQIVKYLNDLATK
ncbi:MAG: 3-deoxy-D-manno-octulosonic acid transferase [Salibacteraceae bacterium]